MVVLFSTVVLDSFSSFEGSTVHNLWLQSVVCLNMVACNLAVYQLGSVGLQVFFVIIGVSRGDPQ